MRSALILRAHATCSASYRAPPLTSRWAASRKKAKYSLGLSATTMQSLRQPFDDFQGFTWSHAPLQRVRAQNALDFGQRMRATCHLVASVPTNQCIRWLEVRMGYNTGGHQDGAVHKDHGSWRKPATYSARRRRSSSRGLLFSLHNAGPPSNTQRPSLCTRPWGVCNGSKVSRSPSTCASSLSPGRRCKASRILFGITQRPSLSSSNMAITYPKLP